LFDGWGNNKIEIMMPAEQHKHFVEMIRAVFTAELETISSTEDVIKVLDQCDKVYTTITAIDDRAYINEEWFGTVLGEVGRRGMQ